MIRAIAAMAVGALLLSGCVYPYENAFQTCDNNAGACYQVCEGAPDDDGIRQCHSVCEAEANQCFDDAYAAQDYAQTSYAYSRSRPWYGSYGYWGPGSGYVFSFDYYSRRGGRYYDPYYGYRRGYRDGRRSRHGYRDGRYRDGRERRHDGRGRHGRRGDGEGRGRGGRGGEGRGRGQGDGATPPASPPPRARPPRTRPPQTRPPRARPPASDQPQPPRTRPRPIRDPNREPIQEE